MGIQNSFPGPTGVTDQTEARKDFAGLIVRDTSGNARAGIFPRHTNALVTARSDMQVDVATFESCSVRGGGPLFQANDGTAQVTITTAPGSNSRLDVVYSKQNESASPYSDADNNAILAVQAGPVSVSPLLATTIALLPAGAVPLASVLMPAGKTATNQSGVVITPIFAYTALTGSPIWVRTAADLLVTSGYNAMNGYTPAQFAYVMDTATLYQWNGTTWVIVIGDTGWITLAPASGWTATNTIQYRRYNGQVFVRGGPTKGTTVAVADAMTAALPVNFRPTTLEPVAAILGNGTLAGAGVQNTGVIVAYPGAGGNNQVIFHGSFIAEQ